MIRYALDLPKLMTEAFSVSEEVQRLKNYYDILVKFLLYLIEPLLQQGLYNSYGKYEENLMSVRGKILFKENLLRNYNRPDKVFCNYSELTADILENRIIKYTLFHLSKGHFFDDSVSVRIKNCYKRFDQVEIVPIHSDYFKSIQYTPLNEHYRPILSLCELLLSDSSLDLETIGERTAISFLLDMNKLFEKFIANLLAEKIGQFNVKIQETEYPEINEEKLRVRIDIEVLQNGSPSLILDTKYKELRDMSEEGYIADVAQLVLYSVSTGVKKLGLIYVGKLSERRRYTIKSGITLYFLCFNLLSSSIAAFEQNCSDFVEDIRSILADD
jgi:5-methylcytosine-specific restriction enzyme subunit McrC